MTTAFPTALDNFSNPTSTSNMDDVGVLHSDQHANTNDAIEAIEARIGTSTSVDPATITGHLVALQNTLQPKVEFTGAPATAISTGTAGTIIVAGGFLYVCVATNSWVRAAIGTWV